MYVSRVAIAVACLTLVGCAASYGVQFTRLTDTAYEATAEAADVPVLVALPANRQSVLIGIANVNGTHSFADLLNKVRAKAREVGGHALIDVQTNTALRTSLREKPAVRPGSTFGPSRPSAPPEKISVTEEVRMVSAKVIRFLD